MLRQNLSLEILGIGLQAKKSPYKGLLNALIVVFKDYLCHFLDQSCRDLLSILGQ